jgi:hypothetical protein
MEGDVRVAVVVGNQRLIGRSADFLATAKAKPSPARE